MLRVCLAIRSQAYLIECDIFYFIIEFSIVYPILIDFSLKNALINVEILTD